MYKLIRTFFKKIVPTEFVRWYKRRKELFSWHLSDKKGIPPALVKQKIVRTTGKKHDIKTLIETGTAGGRMITATKNHFSKIFSIELNDVFYENATAKFAKYDHIDIVHGDSGEKMIEILPTINDPILFWLDAHYSGGGTSRGPLDTPIMKELQTILSRGNKCDVILIDDARCFNGTEDYPTIEQVKELIQDHKHLTLKVHKDIIFIEPNNLYDSK